MGFQPKRTEYELDFDGTEFEGLTLRVFACTMEERLRVWYDLEWTEQDSPEDRKAKQDELFEMFIAHVIEWDLDDRQGNPAPVTLDGLRAACEPQQVGAIVGVWRVGRQKVPGPLGQPSPGFSPSEIPMTVQPSTCEHAA